MPYYFKILESFILTVLMDKNEYNFFHKNFRPIKLLTILLLLSNVVFTVYLLNVLYKVQQKIELQCPNFFDKKIASKKTK